MLKKAKIISAMKKFFSRTLNKIILILSIPAVILIIFAVLNNTYHIRQYESLIMSNYSNELNNFLHNTEDELYSLLSDSRFIATNPNINYLLTTTERPDSRMAAEALSTLQQATKFSSILDSIAIYNKEADFVMSSNGLYDASAYFDAISAYDKYSYSYWLEYRSILGDAKILPPTTLHSTTSTLSKTIVPFVFTSLNHITSNNLVIFNISVNELFTQFEYYRLTNNTKIYIVENATGNIYYESSLSDTDTFEYKFINTIKNSLLSNTDIVSVNNRKYLLIQSTERSSFWGYTYLVAVPYTDISGMTTNIFFISCLFLLILFVVIAAFIFFGSNALYLPWKKLAKAANYAKKATLSANDRVPSDMSSYISDTILDISKSHENLRESLSATLPLSQEKYLIDILNNDIDAEQTENLLEPLAFQYDYFVAVAISIKINHQFLIDNPQVTADEISKKLHNAIVAFFSSSFITYVLPGSNNILYLLLNVEDENVGDLLKDTIAKLQSIFEIDSDNLDIVFGTGNIYKGFDGLKLTHQEAVLNMLKSPTSKKVQFSAIGNKYIFSSHSENILINYLTAGLTEKAAELLNNIFNTISADSFEARHQVYLDIVSALKKVVRQKGLAISELSSVIDVMQNNPSLSDEEIQGQILTFCNTIAEHMQLNSNKINIKEIINYINDHYNENIMLGDLAQLFNTSPKYLSKRIKQYLGLPFKDYLTNLKIEKAKELLEQTNITISELYQYVGFQNRTAFTRAFKLKTGMAPSDYKKMSDPKNSD